ncbi:MAG TPA: hypothetical protein VNH39_01175 [Steroidobacteraceae bacterium]|nr:hypothetical protein [Steroidobacteraceae bacterium]
MEAVIDGWPIGSKRTIVHFAIEVVPGRGERGTRYTIDPKTGKPSATKKLTYARKASIVDGDDGKTYIIELTSIYGHIVVMQGGMQYQAEDAIFERDPRYAVLLKLFDDVSPPLLVAGAARWAREQVKS